MIFALVNENEECSSNIRKDIESKEKVSKGTLKMRCSNGQIFVTN